MRVRVQVDLAGGRMTTLDVAGQSIHLGRNPDCEVAVDPVAFPKVSGVHAQIESRPLWRALRRQALQWRAGLEARHGRTNRWARRLRAARRLDRIRRHPAARTAG